jgi:hypothetical protein
VENASHSVEFYESRLTVRITVTGIETGTVRNALEDGSRSEIRYRIRLYRERSGPAAFLGDALVYEHTVVYSGSHDLFSGDYILNAPGGERRFSSFPRFLESFSTVTHRISMNELPPAEGLALLYQVAVTPRSLVPPFTMLRPFIPDIERTTPWQRAPLLRGTPAEGGTQP